MSASCQAPPPWVDLAGLELSEQLVLWIWRELHAERAQPSATLVAGLRLAFGLCRVEDALDRVLALWRSYDGYRRRPPSVAARRAPLVLAEERLLIGLIATPGASRGDPAAPGAQGRVRQLPDRPARPAGDAAGSGFPRH
jgi:hypothetical protein